VPEDRVRQLRLVLVLLHSFPEELDRPADVVGVHDPARDVRGGAGCPEDRLQRPQPLFVPVRAAAGRPVAEFKQRDDDDQLRTPSQAATSVVRGGAG
jgi:hypothetical protein